MGGAPGGGLRPLGGQQLLAWSGLRPQHRAGGLEQGPLGALFCARRVGDCLRVLGGILWGHCGPPCRALCPTLDPELACLDFSGGPVS